MFSVFKTFKIMELSTLQAFKCSTFPTFKTLSLTNPKPFVVHVELNRPEKLNAMNNTMWK